MDVTHINKRSVASVRGATVVAAAAALLFIGAGAAQAQVRPGDLPLGPVAAPADCQAKRQAAADAQTALTNVSEQYGVAVKAQATAQERYDFDKKGPFWNSTIAPIDNPAGDDMSVGTFTVGQADSDELNAANKKVADLKAVVLADLATRNNTAAAAQGC